MVDTVIGGDQELAALREFLTTSREGARALVLEGEAGIGKTTLWQEGLALARAQQVKVLSARPAVAESGLAHVGLGDLFDRHLDELLPATPAPGEARWRLRCFSPRPAGGHRTRAPSVSRC